MPMVLHSLVVMNVAKGGLVMMHTQACHKITSAVQHALLQGVGLRP